MTEKLTAGERLAPRRDPDAEAPKPGKPARAPKPKRRASVLGRLLATFMGLIVLGGILAGLAGFIMLQRFSADLPDHDRLASYQPRVMSRVYAADSRLLAELATERRIFVPIAAIPAVVQQAFISAEDQNFRSHKGVDPIAIARAVVTDLAQYGQGKRPIGASTITQQVAKNMLVGNEASLARKVREAIMAVRIEQSLSKDRILELYLNEIYLGLQAYGVAAAAGAYFNKPLSELTLPEAAFLAALPKAPNNFNPFRYPDAARQRRDYVLDRMADDRAITPAEAQAAKATPLVPSALRRPETVPGADYFAEEVRRTLIDRFGADQTTQGGLMVRTTLDPALQEAADKAIHDGLIRYDQRRGGWRGPVQHLELGVRLKTSWPESLAGIARPPGMLAQWRLAAVLETADQEARLGVLDGTTQRILPMQLSDTNWARPALDGDKFGPAPRKMADILKPGDVVMVDTSPATPAQGRTAARPERLLLRQVPKVQAALAAIEVATGRVVALSGGWSFELSQFNRATQANRQPGSSFKPFVYLTALEAGISPSQRFLDAPFVVDLGAQGKWRPSNFEQNFSGPTPLRFALEQSLNLVTVRVADRVGMEAVARNAKAFHIVDDMPRVLPAALGAVETTVLREVAAYAGLAAGGREVIPTLIDTVQDRDGHVIWAAPAPKCDPCTDPAQSPSLADQRPEIADPASVFQLITMMQGVVQRGTGVNAGTGLNRQIAGKTGTSQDFTDNWFVGFAPDLAVGVWMGFDNNTSLGNNETGGATAAPVWHDFMAVALKSRPNLKFNMPQGLTMAAWSYNGQSSTDAFKPGQEPGGSQQLPGPGGNQPAGDTPAVASDTPKPAPGGVDTSLGGLY
jgi:penicillin-binding protein 1A